MTGDSGWEDFRGVWLGSIEGPIDGALEHPVLIVGQRDDGRWQLYISSLFSMSYEPRSAYKSIQCPILGLFADQDKSVIAIPNSEELKKILEKSGNPTIPGSDFSHVGARIPL
ncbi:MAG: hypothetical protein HQM10_22780 [Candidatus Riflebacteria bacterium]|nr:hypothetical protein [Candidatus Riflebacteria bacterium]